MPGPIGTDAPDYGMTDALDPSVFVVLGAILVGGFLLMVAATWYTARRAGR